MRAARSLKRSIWLASALLLSFTLPHFAAAQFSPSGAELQVNQTTAGDQTAPAVSADTAGDFAVVWQSQDASGSSIVGRLFGPSGAATSGEIAVSGVSATFCRRAPSVSSSAAGSFVVVWQSQGEDGAGWGVFGRRFAATGTALGPAFQVNTTTVGDQQSPRVSMAPDGSFLVVWESFGQDGSGWGIFARGYDATGAALGGEVQVNATVAGDQRHPALTLQPSGARVVVWESAGQDGSGTAIVGRRVSGTGAAQAGEFLVNVTTAGFQSSPTVSADGSGNFLVAWESSGADGSSSGIALRRFDRTGAPQTTEGLANATVGGLQSRPVLASASGGDYEAVWESADGDQGSPGIFGQRFTFADQPQLAELRINSYSPGVQRRPALAGAPGGTFLAVWESLGQDGDRGGIYAQRYSVAALGFFPLTPCRILDTRASGGSPLVSGTLRTFQITPTCGIPATARVISVNVTVADGTNGGTVVLYPADADLAPTSSVSFHPNQVRSNNAILTLARDGVGDVRALATLTGGGTLDLILDVNGYFR